MKRRALLALTPLAVLPLMAQAQAPQTVRLLVGYPAGGAVDAAARQFAPLFGRELGANVVVENRPGANGTLAGDVVVRAPADGNTLWFTASSTLTIVPHLVKKMPFDPVRDLAPVAPLITFSNVLLVGKDSPLRTLKDLVARAKSGQLSYGSPGVGSSSHLSSELFADRIGAKLLHVPYKGSAPAMTDLIGGQLDMMFDIIGSARTHVASGRVRPLAVTAQQRNPALPEVPTFAELGIANFDQGGWYGLYGPSGLPAASVARLNAAARRVLAQTELQRQWSEQGYVVWPGTPEGMAQHAAAELQVWKPVTRGISID
ncbi:MAG: hypothetical protein RL522_1010 [Pseudomonadota bacterium]|jgi:tripartite-type tricarboxylate transporter receptor subunit TctC